jgi:hypothetical protein
LCCEEITKMTAQISEKLLFEDEKHAMCTNPLGDYAALGGELPRFASNCTALWRGYVGTWEIIGDRLYLIELSGELESAQEANLETVFPGYGERVFAHWYSGTIRLPQGKMLEYIHMGYGSTYERDLLLEFKKGVLTSRRVKVNGVAEDENASEGYGVGAMTVFSKEKRERGDQS